MVINGLYIICHYADLLAELVKREKEANIKTDPDVDDFMKVRVDCILCVPLKEIGKRVIALQI